jgi:hypothetical protein
MKQPSEKHLSTIMQAFRTFHNYLHVADQTMDHTQGLCYSHPSLLLRQSIQSLKDSLYLALSQQLLCKFHCHRDIEQRAMYIVKADWHLLNRPCLICFVARASTESSSIMIFTMISVIIGVGGIVV